MRAWDHAGAHRLECHKCWLPLDAAVAVPPAALAPGVAICEPVGPARRTVRMPNDPDYRFSPIAYVESPYAQRLDAPHQPTVVAGTESGQASEAVVRFAPGVPAAAWADLAGFDRIWLVFVFHRSQGWTAQVRPPRGGGKRGVLATRSPHRPNPIGLSAVELVAVEEGCLRVRGVDLLDGTPVLDVKPYVPYADAFPQARAGWIDALDAVQGLHSAPGPKRPRRMV